MVKFVIIFCTFWTAAMGYIVFHHLEKNREWNKFLSDQQCTSVSGIEPKSSAGFGIRTDGKIGTVFVTEPGRKCWICKNGKQHCK